MSTVLDLNRRLATALGWSNIVDVGNALLGSPPWAIPHARGQAQVPNWAGCWKDCGPLLAQYEIDQAHEPFAVGAVCPNAAAVEVGTNLGRDVAVRFAIVHAVIAKLEAAK